MVLLKIKNLTKTYVENNPFGRFRKEEKMVIRNVSLDIFKGEIIALVGESGSGKTTLARALLRFVEPSAGEIIYRGQNLLQLSQKQFRPYRRHFQMIFQHPDRALNPRQTVAAVLSEAIRANGKIKRENTPAHIHDLLELVHLNGKYLTRYPLELSGGEQQRLLIARALAVEPEFLIADEPTSSLDAVVKRDILNLLIVLKEKLSLTLLFISHDLRAVAKVADRIAVMYSGTIVEIGSRDAICHEAAHPYTRMMLHSIRFDERISPEENSSFPAALSACIFASRCPEATELCRSQNPPVKQISPGHYVSCHLYLQAVVERPAAVAV